MFGPRTATLLAMGAAAWVGADESPWASLAWVVALFGGTLLLVIAVRRATGGPEALRRQRLVPWVLAGEVAALAVGLAVGVPREVVGGFLAFFAVGLIALAGARRNISAHGLMAGVLVGLLAAWVPVTALVGVPLLAAIAYSRIVLRQHTATQAAVGAALGLTAGVVAALLSS